jgi:hypothetical protein
VQAYGAFDRILELATDMQFKRVGDRMEIPSADLCAQNPNLSKARKNLEVSYGMLREQVSQISYCTTRSRSVLGRGGCTARPGRWNDAAVMDKVFAVDSLARHYPKRSRIKPSGEYTVAGYWRILRRSQRNPETADSVGDHRTWGLCRN